MADTFSFTGFDGNKYELPTFLNTDNYNYYIFIKTKVGGIRVYYFNENVHIYKASNSSSSNLVLIERDGNSPYYFYFIRNNEWVLGTSTSAILDYNTDVVIYSSDNLLKYASEFNDLSDVYIDSSMINSDIVTFTLSPIVEEINDNNPFVNFVFDEVFSILPVLLVVLVSLIGLRKAINWLLSMLRHT